MTLNYRPPRTELAMFGTRPETVIVVATTLAATAILAIVVLHVLAN